MKINADFNDIAGRIKPMHGIGQPPMMGLNNSLMHYVEEAGLPYSRLHDVQGAFSANLYVDIPNIFRDFNADAEDPSAYDFAFTDRFLSAIVATGCKPFYRLGVTIENYHNVKAYRIYPPSDNLKWARICEHIVRHYNEGWADGFHFDIKYWEIWNEPDNLYPQYGGMWKGTPQQYYELYVTVAKHLKVCFGDSVKVGGYASCGFYDHDVIDPYVAGFDGIPKSPGEIYIQFAHNFLKFIREQNAPLDFFSWHRYGTPLQAVSDAKYCRKMLEKYGYGDVEDILNEWNTCHHHELRNTAFAASQAFGMMLSMQKMSTGMLCYYDARCNASEYGGMFNPDSWKPYLTYYGFKSFNEAYRLGNEARTASDDELVPVCGATDGRQKVLLIANMHDSPVTAELSLEGVQTMNAEIFMINDEYKYTDTGKHLGNGQLLIPENTCVEIRFK